MPAFLRDREVHWGDCDAFGIVYYPHFMSWCDETFHKLAEDRGFGQRGLPDRGIAGTPLRDIGATFHSPVSYGDTLTIAATVSDLGRSSFRMNYRLTCKGRHVADTHEVRVFTAWTKGRLHGVEIPEDIRAILQELAE